MKVRRQILHSENDEEDRVPSDDDDSFDANRDSIEDTDYLNLEKDTKVSNFVLVKLLNKDKRISKFFLAKVLEKNKPRRMEGKMMYLMYFIIKWCTPVYESAVMDFWTNAVEGLAMEVERAQNLYLKMFCYPLCKEITHYANRVSITEIA
ncbi:hypothetical protein AVEN_213351-1 [Araneus ventricosus]|uniref:Uncharacterized protein n=1 Tax=Araneus ventricosus TaxID=182803 RepID=A0A4Y2JCI6_ARAVE|nr:hypothetical protein AVEN_213351-1 [Araneus ventricosus]